MRRSATAALLGIALLMPGCAYKDQYTYSNTRKLMDSDAPGVTKVFFAPFIGLFESICSPVTSYLDSTDYAGKQKDHVYLSYIGAQTLYSSDLHGAYKFFGSFFVLPIDTAWFPFAGTVDTIHALTSATDESPEEARRRRQQDEPHTPR